MGKLKIILYPCLSIILFNFRPSSIFLLNPFILADTLFSNSSSVQLICSSLVPILSSVFPSYTPIVTTLSSVFTSCFFICLFKTSPLIDLKQTLQVFVLFSHHAFSYVFSKHHLSLI